MSATRTDIHRPSAPEFDPTDYVCVGVFYFGSTPNAPMLGAMERDRHREAINALLADGWTCGGVYGSRQCSHCGSHLSYAALMQHRPTRTFLHIGEDCLENRFELDSRAEFEAAQAAILREIAWRERDAQRAAESAAEAAIAKPHPTGRVDIEGVVLTVKEYEDNYSPYGGWIFKMLVQHADGWKVWGTVPREIDPDRGSRVRFTATIEPGRDGDPTFGIFKRPTKADLI